MGWGCANLQRYPCDTQNISSSWVLAFLFAKALHWVYTFSKKHLYLVEHALRDHKGCNLGPRSVCLYTVDFLEAHRSQPYRSIYRFGSSPRWSFFFFLLEYLILMIWSSQRPLFLGPRGYSHTTFAQKCEQLIQYVGPSSNPQLAKIYTEIKAEYPEFNIPNHGWFLLLFSSYFPIAYSLFAQKPFYLGRKWSFDVEHLFDCTTRQFELSCRQRMGEIHRLCHPNGWWIWRSKSFKSRRIWRYWVRSGCCFPCVGRSCCQEGCQARPGHFFFLFLFWLPQSK